MAQTTSLVFNGGVIPSPSPAPSGSGKAKLLKIGEITVTEQEVQVTKNVICDPDSVTTVAPFMEVLTSARLAELVQANNILVLDDGTMQYLMSDASIAVEDGTAVCTAVNFLGLSKENRAKVLYPCTRLTDELTLHQVIEVGEPVETGFDLVKAYPEDTEAGTLIDKLEIEDTIDDDPDYQPLLAIVPTDGKVAINEDGLHEVLSELGGGIDNIVDTISEMDMDSIPHAYLHSSLNHSAGDSSTTRTTIDIFACDATPEGDCFEFEQTTTIDDTPYGYLWIEPGTYLINGSVTLQWVGNPRGTFVAKVGSVMGENFDFSQEQEILRNHTKIVTIPNRMKLSINITYDAGTPVMGFWIQSLQVVKLAGGMSQTNITHDSTLVGQGSVADPIGVDEAKVAQSTLAGNLAPAFDPTRTEENPYKAGNSVVYNGKTYIFNADHSGIWIGSDVDEVSVMDVVKNGYDSKWIDITLDNVVTGYYYDRNGNLLSNASSAYCNITFTASDVGKKVKIHVTDAAASGRCTLLCDADENVIKYVTAAQVVALGRDYVFEAEIQEGYILKMSWDTTEGTPTASTFVRVPSITELIEDQSEQIGELNDGIFGHTTILSSLSGTPVSGYYYNTRGQLIADANSNYVNIELSSPPQGSSLAVNVFGTLANIRACLLCDSDGNVLESFVTRNTVKTPVRVGVYTGTYHFKVAPVSGYVLKLSWDVRDGEAVANLVDYKPPVETDLAQINQVVNNTIYVSASGSDNNDGSIYTPVKTIDKAVNLGAKTVVIKEGVYTFGMMDISKAQDFLTIKGENGKKVIIKRQGALLCDSGNEALVAGYTQVYTVACSDPTHGHPEIVNWLYFDGLPDRSTAILPADEHPLQRGQYYRCDCTCIKKCVSNNLADALTEIENAEDYRWFYDNGNIYFNRADGTNVYPVYAPAPSEQRFFVTRENQSLTLSNIEFRYGSVNLTNLNIVKLYNVSCKYVSQDCFQYNNSTSVTFERCEACRAHYATTGDGFNAHVTGAVDRHTKYCTAILKECWSHDNNDDGYSDHEYAETTVEGGLYEYNGKAGITPSYGSHCVCNNVYSRHNYNGFYYPGSPNDGGNGGQMVCYNCVSESNDGRSSATDCGFKIDGNLNHAILVGCKSINNKVDFGCSGNATMRLIDCSVVGTINTTFSGTGFEVVSTLPVTQL